MAQYGERERVGLVRRRRRGGMHTCQIQKKTPHITQLQGHTHQLNINNRKDSLFTALNKYWWNLSMYTSEQPIAGL